MLEGEGFGDISALLNSDAISVDDSDESITHRVHQYITKGLIPNLQGLYAEIQSRIANQSGKEHERMDVIDLKEQLFVETIKLLTHPEIANRLSLLEKDINEDESNPAIVGLTLVGSAAFGGLLIREALGEDTSPWVDVDLIGSYVLKDGFTRNDIERYLHQTAQPNLAKKLNSKMIKSVGSKDYNLCDAHNIGIGHFSVVQSENEANQMFSLILADQASPSVFYEQFFPSYPPHVNALGRHYLLAALSELAEADIEKWQTVVSKISDGLTTNVKFLKPKHFGKDEDDEISPRLDKINQFIASLFIDLIQETGKSYKK